MNMREKLKLCASNTNKYYEYAQDITKWVSLYYEGYKRIKIRESKLDLEQNKRAKHLETGRQRKCSFI